MLNDIRFLGYHLQTCILDREYGSLPEEINLKVDNISINPDKKIVELEYKIEFTFQNREESSKITYYAGFYVDHDSIMEKSCKENYDFDEEEEQVFTVLSQQAFPFIRQAVFAMTNDSSGGIMIPIINASELRQGIELTKKKKTED